MSVTVVTPTIEGREELLAEACESVQNQTAPVMRHLVWCDTERAGPAVARNAMLGSVRTTLVAFLDDDDVLYADHLRILANAQRNTNADLVFSWHDGGPGVPRFDEWNGAALAMTLGGRNVIPITVLARVDTIRRAGCFDPADRYEDWSLWCRMLELGARFVCVPVVTWEYRIAPDGRTWNP